MPRRLRRYYGAGYLHFITASWNFTDPSAFISSINSGVFPPRGI
jgi:hypothetical protein